MNRSTTMSSIFDVTNSLQEMIKVNSGMSLDKTRSLFDNDPDVSPVTLSEDWSRVARLLLLASLAVVGSVGNVFMISAVMVEDHLRKIGQYSQNSSLTDTRRKMNGNINRF